MTDPTPQFATAEFEPVLEDSHALFMRALLFGGGAAILGLILYSAVGIITGVQIGFMSLGVGWLVGKAMLKGSRDRTGLRYQIAAALFTYFAVSVSAVPMGIAYAVKHPEALTQDAKPISADVEGSDSTSGRAEEQHGAGLGAISLGAIAGQLVLLGLTSPFSQLGESGGIIGLIILAVGIRIAWRMTGKQASSAAAVALPPDNSDEPTALNLNR
jgi:hypothetical protein